MKRETTVYLALITFILLPVFVFLYLNSSALTSSSSTDDSWSMFHNDLSHSGSSNSRAPKTNQTLWKFSTGSQIGSPVAAEGVIYAGSYDRKLYAFNASNGAVLWRYTTGGPVLPPAAVADGLVYVGSEDNNAYAIDACTGVLIWNFTTGYYVDSAAAVSAGMVYVASEDAKVYALNASNGRLVWNYTTGGMIMLSSPAVANGVVYVGSYDHALYAFGSTPNTQPSLTDSLLPIELLMLVAMVTLFTALVGAVLYKRKHKNT